MVASRPVVRPLLVAVVLAGALLLFGLIQSGAFSAMPQHVMLRESNQPPPPAARSSEPQNAATKVVQKPKSAEPIISKAQEPPAAQSGQPVEVVRPKGAEDAGPDVVAKQPVVGGGANSCGPHPCKP